MTGVCRQRVTLEEKVDVRGRLREKGRAWEGPPGASGVEAQGRRGRGNVVLGAVCPGGEGGCRLAPRWGGEGDPGPRDLARPSDPLDLRRRRKSDAALLGVSGRRAGAPSVPERP